MLTNAQATAAFQKIGLAMRPCAQTHSPQIVLKMQRLAITGLSGVCAQSGDASKGSPAGGRLRPMAQR